jgi:SAM-dependent methyltransferase
VSGGGAKMVFADSKERFANRVADYARYRPGYPAAIVALLREECALRPEHVIADIGSGTGLLAEHFLKNGNDVIGVEPNTEMRAGGDEYLRPYATFRSVAGSAETTTLDTASVDFVTAGQAFHWFVPDAARREFLRILKPHGWVTIVWNDRLEGTPFARDYERLLQRYGTDYENVKDAYPEMSTIQEFFASPDFAARDFPNFQLFDLEGLRGRLRSSSYAPTEGHANFAPLMAELEKLFHDNAQGGTVRMEYVTHVYFGHLRAGTKA